MQKDFCDNIIKQEEISNSIISPIVAGGLRTSVFVKEKRIDVCTECETEIVERRKKK